MLAKDLAQILLQNPDAKVSFAIIAQEIEEFEQTEIEIKNIFTSEYGVDEIIFAQEYLVNQMHKDEDAAAEILTRPL